MKSFYLVFMKTGENSNSGEWNSELKFVLEVLVDATVEAAAAAAASTHHVSTGVRLQ